MIARPPIPTMLKTDRYEFTMLDAALHDGTAQRKATFEAFARRLPAGYRFGVVCGMERVAEAIMDFTIDDDALRWLTDQKIVSRRCVGYLANYRFTGDLDVYLDGDLWFPNSPLLAGFSTFAELIVLETMDLSCLNSSVGTATHAAPIVEAAAGRPIIEMATRRNDPDAAVHVARDAYVAGFAATSNMGAGYRYGVPTAGTTAHAWTLAHDSELDAFKAQLRLTGPNTTLLIDTYDIAQGARNAAIASYEVCGEPVAKVRIDSGDLDANARLARGVLDANRCATTEVVVTSDLDRVAISALVTNAAPVDAFGVGTKLVEAPKAGIVYKIVDVETGSGEMRPVEKKSANKVSYGGRKVVTRTSNDDGTIRDERLTIGGPGEGYLVQRRLFDRGALNEDVLAACDTHSARARCDEAKTLVPAGHTVTTIGPADSAPVPNWEMQP